MRRPTLFAIQVAVALTVPAAADARQEVLLPGVYIEEMTARLPGGETAHGPVRPATSELAPARVLTPNGRGPLPNTATIEVPPGVLQRMLRGAHAEGLGLRASVSGKDSQGRYVVTSVRHMYVSAVRTSAAGMTLLDLTSRDRPAPVVACSADTCAGPADDFFFLYHCVVNRHTYIPAAAGERNATCVLDP